MWLFIVFALCFLSLFVCPCSCVYACVVVLVFRVAIWRASCVS